MRNMTMTAALPAELGHRPRRHARRNLRRRELLKMAASLVGAALAGVALWLSGALAPAPVPASGGYSPVTLIRQNPELPNGCEVTSLAMVLKAAGCPADKLELYRDYLPKADFSRMDGKCYGPNPERWYVGDASDLTGGWYCFEEPIVQAANGWLDDQGSTLRAHVLTGLDRKGLDRYAQAGTPLAVWVTLDYAAPQRSEFFWLLEDGTAYYPYRNLHCVVLAGVEDGKYRVADPISGITLVEKETFWSSFSAMGSRAVAVDSVNTDQKGSLGR